MLPHFRQQHQTISLSRYLRRKQLYCTCKWVAETSHLSTLKLTHVFQDQQASPTTIEQRDASSDTKNTTISSLVTPAATLGHHWRGAGIVHVLPPYNLSQTLRTTVTEDSQHHNRPRSEVPSSTPPLPSMVPTTNHQNQINKSRIHYLPWSNYPLIR